jgi:putative tricarboxylic transport membrane protein
LKKYDLSSGLFWLLIGLGFTGGGLRYGFGSWTGPGPGLLPVVFGVILMILSVGLLAAALFGVKEGKTKLFWQAGGSWKPILFTVIALLAYMALLKPAGFIPTTFLLVFYLLKFIGGKRWLISIGCALVSAFLCFYLFSGLLGTPLPKGQLYGFHLGSVAGV